VFYALKINFKGLQMFNVFKSKKKQELKRGLTYMVDGTGVIILDSNGLSREEVENAVKKIKASMTTKKAFNNVKG
jgi:hypothetical protein